MTRKRAPSDASALWLKVHQEIVDRGAHELRNALNAVAVNLEVVRSRLGRQPVDLTAVAPFAETASTAMDGLSTLAEAFLTLARPARQPADVGSLLTAIFAVLEPFARRDNDELFFRAPAPGDGITSAPADVTRLVLAAVALEAVRDPATVHCVVEPVEGDLFVLRFIGWFPIQLPDAIVQLARGADILFQVGRGDGVTLTFPVFRG